MKNKKTIGIFVKEDIHQWLMSLSLEERKEVYTDVGKYLELKMENSFQKDVVNIDIEGLVRKIANELRTELQNNK